MKKRLQVIWLSLMLILLAGIGSVQAAGVQITWDADPTYDFISYQVNNSGVLRYINQGYSFKDLASEDDNSAVLDAEANVDATFTHGSETTIVSGRAGGSYLSVQGGDAGDGVKNTAFAGVTQATDTNIYFDTVTQYISSNVKRSFKVEGNAEVTVTSKFEDLIDWTAFDDGDFTNTSYSIIGTVTVLPSIAAAQAGQDTAKMITLEDFDEYGTGTITFTPVDGVEYYRLYTTLIIKTELNNVLFPNLGQTLDVGNIGELTLTTTVTASAVPVPGSMILLFSGVAGLAALLRRSKY